MKQTKLMVMAMMAVALMATSCASKKDLQNCQNENKELSSNYQATKEKLAATEASLAAAQEQLATAKSDYAKLQNSLDKSLNNASQNNVSIEKLVDQINESNQYIRHLVEVKSKSDSLNMVLTNNLTRSLSKEEMKEVDVQVLKGVVYISLADNMLYQSGSYEVNSRAQETLSKIAKIITDYKDYDVLVEGNTDNVPVSTTSAKMKNIRNNWDLSALRAASVVQYCVGEAIELGDVTARSVLHSYGVTEHAACFLQVYRQHRMIFRLFGKDYSHGFALALVEIGCRVHAGMVIAKDISYMQVRVVWLMIVAGDHEGCHHKHPHDKSCYLCFHFTPYYIIGELSRQRMLLF